MCGIVDRKLSSEVGFKGIFRKTLILIIVGIGHIIDTQVIGNGSALRGAIICYYLSNEGVSILENAAHLGLPVPQTMKNVLIQLHGKEEERKEESNGNGE